MKTVLALIISFTFLMCANRQYAVSGHPQRLPSNANIGDRGGVEDERGIISLDQTLREITNPFTVLSIAARPGDEDDGTLAYVRKKLGARVVMLFATRGESEDSWPDTEIDRDLGTVHTNEAIEGARLIGADVFFLNLRDIGY